MKGCCAHIVTNRLTLSTKCGIKLKSFALRYREISMSNKQTKIVIVFILNLENSPKLYSLRFIYNRISLRTSKLPIRVYRNIHIPKIFIFDNFHCLDQRNYMAFPSSIFKVTISLIFAVLRSCSLAAKTRQKR